ncbi:MAG: hypothetical protein JST32_04295 [Bacteroidetes bacterium]|nr:hypothetical protein [Bacteroidota bacterium]
MRIIDYIKNSVVILFPIFLLSFESNVTYVNPTGTYKLKTDPTIKKGEIGHGYNGRIRVKALSDKKIVISLYVDKGYPSYHSGEIWDTLVYRKNQSTYRPVEFDPSCKIVFTFTKLGVDVVQSQKDLNNGCGFGQGVLADGYYRKISSKTPVLKDPETDN